MNTYSFKRQLVMSAGVSATDDVKQILLENVPGAKAVRKASPTEDRSGTDWWIEHARDSELSVDTKIRPLDPIEKYGKDDLALETWSVVPGSHSRDRSVSAIGWTLDETKRTDYVLWLWQNTRRWCLVPFPQLCAVFKRRQDTWYEIYKHAEQTTTKGGASYRSEMLLVPRREVWAAIYEDFGGSLKLSEPLHAELKHGSKRRSPGIGPLSPSTPSACADCGSSSSVMMEMTAGMGEGSWWLCSKCWIATTKPATQSTRDVVAALAKRGIV